MDHGVCFRSGIFSWSNMKRKQYERVIVLQLGSVSVHRPVYTVFYTFIGIGLKLLHLQLKAVMQTQFLQTCPNSLFR